MPQPLEVLTAMPAPDVFYERYWNTAPFVVRDAIQPSDIESLISADELAGLAMEEAPQSRLVQMPTAQHNWTCRFGPFSEQVFMDAGDKNWSLLVQNVEQFHPPTSNLLRHFNFSPRWLMDDIMVSYSEPGGTVGAHIDNYHVFLVQGQGERQWRVGQSAINDEIYIQGLDFKILQTSIAGNDVTLTCGDVLYIPPRFAHQGTTMTSALTFSVGFLGPKLSELLSGYGQYLSQFDDGDPRFIGDGLLPTSAGFCIHETAVDALKTTMSGAMSSQAFSRWLVEFFSENSHENFGQYCEREQPLDESDFQAQVDLGRALVKPEYVKFVVVDGEMQTFCVGFDAHHFTLNENLRPLVDALMTHQPVPTLKTGRLLKINGAVEFLCELFNHQALEFVD